MTKRSLTLLAVLVLFGAGACDAKESFDEKRGRSDSPVGKVNDDPKEVIQFPDRFSNVAHACDGHGHRVYVTTKSDSSRFMAVIDDPSCGGAE